MKYIILIGISLLAISLIAKGLGDSGIDLSDDSSTTAEINWLNNLDDAMKEAQKTNLPILVNFTGSDWCGWCVKLDNEVFSKEAFQTYSNENLIMVKLDFPKKIKQSQAVKQYNNTQASKYGIRGFPTILLLDEFGKEIDRTGYQPGGPAAYIDHLNVKLGK